MRIERFFHIRPAGSIRGGATVRAVGEVGSNEVEVQVTHCSQKDQFSRKDGRKVATQKQCTKLPLDQLPKKLERVAHQVVRHDKNVSRAKRTEHPLWNTDFGFSTKYFTPKAQANG
jgi:hypothetical protein